GVDGRPLPELVVRLRAIEPASSAIAPIELGVRVQREARTDANAEFTFEALPAGAYEIEAASVDGRSTWRRLAVGGDERRVELWLHEQPFAGNATVKVIDAAKRSVAGAAVTLVLHCTRHGAIGWDGAPAIRGTTDALGTFQLNDPQRLQTVFEGLVIATTDDGRAGTRVIGRPEHRGDRSYWEVTVDKQGEIAASITGVGGDALAAVQVFAEPSACYRHVWPEGPRYPLLRSADGTFTASVPAGRYHVRVMAPGKRRLLDEPVEDWQSLPAVSVKPGARAETAIALGDAPVVRGRVCDEHGAPVDGAEVRALRATPGFAVFMHTDRGPQPDDVYGGSKARTGAAGEYELSLAPGTWHVVATAAGHAMDVHGDVVLAEQPVALEHRLRADGALQGATDRSWLALRAEDAPSVVHGIPVSGGVFAVRGLAPGTWQAGRYHDGKFTTLTTFQITAGGLVWLDLDRATAGTARGMVQHAGSPVPGLDVLGADQSGAYATTATRTTTGDDGSFALAVHAGATELRLEHRGVLLQRVRWQPEDERRDLGAIALHAQRISVQAVGPDGRPEAATIWAANWNDHDREPIRRFAPDGRLDGQWMPAPGQARPAVGVRFADGSEQSVDVTAADREIVVRRRPGGSLELRVLDPEGCPRPAAMFEILPWARPGDAPQDGASFVAARDRSAPGGYALTDARGRAIVHGIMPGPALVYFAGDWGDFGPGGNGRRGPSPLEQVVVVRAGTTQVVDLVLPRF
ncbi:MAG TPA: carboxypeptidase-like regulatory domain-containing protein, partial [Planctomycetota bacterium]|nr:carboxypeptidase-like regulatory domain-containing protein [Planctomycetota bacterium]